MGGGGLFGGKKKSKESWKSGPLVEKTRNLGCWLDLATNGGELTWISVTKQLDLQSALGRPTMHGGWSSWTKPTGCEVSWVLKSVGLHVHQRRCWFDVLFFR